MSAQLISVLSPSDRAVIARVAELPTALALERLERRAASFCNLVEAHLRAGDDCVPAGLRDTRESDVVAAMQDLRGLINADAARSAR